MTSAIRTEHLTKFYGRSRGIVDVDLEVQAGEVFGFLGPNGAGKTTTIRLLLDLIRPTRGRAEVLGLDVRRDRIAIHRRISYLPGEVALYGDLTAHQYLAYFGNLHGDSDGREVQQLIERLELDPTVRVKSLSRGNRQKVGLVAAFMGKPELLILDEPSVGLDPLIQLEFERMVNETRAEGRTVFLCSHILPEVEHLCDRVGIIREGGLLAVESVSDLKARALRRLRIEFSGPVDETAFAGLPGVRDIRIDDGSLTCTVMGSLDALVKAAARFRVHDVTSQETSLEEIFLAYYGEGSGNAAA